MRSEPQPPDTRQYDAGSPGTGKSHLAVALGVEAIKAGRSVYFSTLADLIASLAKAEREGTLRERIRFLSAFALLIVDEIGYLPVVPGGGNLFFQLGPLREGRPDPDLEPGLCRVGRGVRPSRGRDRLAGPPSPPRGGDPDRGLQLPASSARRPRARARALESPDHATARAQAPGTSAAAERA